jgi:membrane fusion protein (multidrug efflux system)
VEQNPVDQRRRQRLFLIGGGTAFVAIVGLWLYATSGRYMSTDDASVMAAQTAISANIAGRVTEIDVHDNQIVHRGDVLFQLDERPLRIQVEAAEAKLALTRQQISAAKATYRLHIAGVEAARNTLAYQQHELERQTALVEKGITSRLQFDQTQHAVDLAQKDLAAAEQQGASVLATLGGDADLPIDRHPAVQQAQADLERAKLDLSYATVVAPDDGVVTKVEQLQVGNYINAAIEVFTLVSSQDRWIEANFKEDQLAHMQPGQSADVTVDAFPDRKFRAQVQSVSPGTGSQFSALPAENATGNWVKVVQRVPVRLTFQDLPPDMALRLHSGLSANVTVDTRHHRWSFGSAETQSSPGP